MVPRTKKKSICEDIRSPDLSEIDIKKVVINNIEITVIEEKTGFMENSYVFSKDGNVFDITNMILSESEAESMISTLKLIETNGEKKRISGFGCYEKDSEGFDDPYEFREDFNTDDADTIIKYINTEKGISFDIPYNSDWGNKNCEVLPYKEFMDSYGTAHLIFGKPRAWISDTFRLNISISSNRDIETILLEQQQDDIEVFKPREKTIGDKQMVVYESYGTCTSRIYEVVGKGYNYSFDHFYCEEPIVDIIKELEGIIATVEFID